MKLDDDVDLVMAVARGIRTMLDRASAAERRATVAEARIAQYEEVGSDERAEIQRLIREVGSLERQLCQRGDVPDTYKEDGVSVTTVKQEG